jgi:hypothetical protein
MGVVPDILSGFSSASILNGGFFIIYISVEKKYSLHQSSLFKVY